MVILNTAKGNGILRGAALFVLCSAFITAFPVMAETFSYNGRTVTREYYDAVLVARDTVSLLHAKEYAKAEPIMAKVVEVVNDDPNILLNYALILVKVGKPKEAIPYYQKVAILNPKEENVWTGLASAYGAAGQLSDSLKATEEFLKLFPDSPNHESMKNQAMTISKEVKRQTELRGNAPADSLSYTSAVATSDGERHRWSNAEMPLSVYIDSGKGVPFWSAELDSLLHKAFDEWAEASKGLISFKFVDNPKEAKITCNWTNDTHKLRNLAEQGDTHMWWREKSDLSKAEITLLTRSPLEAQVALEKDKIKQTALHEVGHALGIGGHSSDPKDVMYFANTSVSTPQLSERDKKTIQEFYGLGVMGQAAE